MKASRITLLSAMALTLCSAPAFAQACKKPAPVAPLVSKVTIRDFTLKQVSTRKLSDSVSSSLYTGETLMMILPCDPTAWPTAMVVRVELKTTTLLNACGDGLTDGVLTLAAPELKQAISGPLVAINEDFGELTGIVEGRLLGMAAPPTTLRAAFKGTFVKDDAGDYTLVNVVAGGVSLATPRPAGPKK